MDESYFQLVRTKLCLPRLRAKIVKRKRLVEKAEPEQGIVLTLVSAPAGYGKTTLLVELSNMLAQSGTSIVWYSLDENDNDPNLFCSYLITGISEALEMDDILAPIAMSLRSSTEFNMERILPALINAVVSNDRKCLLVLDDYHLITSPAIHNMMIYLLGHLPGNMHVVIGSRSDPPLALARLRAGSKMNELRLADLCFTPDEATQFLNEKMSLDLSSREITEIETNTEGWITGLQLAAISVASMGNSADLIGRFGGSSRYLVDYLLQEVIERQPVEIQQFLLSTSVLDRLCGPLCDAVLGGKPVSENILNQLELKNLFIIPLDDEGYWFRYHHLFQEFLRNRLKLTNIDRIPDLHRAASEWYSSQNLLREAVFHSFGTLDLNYAAGVVERHGMKMVMLSEISILLNWCESFPEEIFAANPMLCILHGWALSLSYRKECRSRVEQRVQQAEHVASSLDDKQKGNWLTGQAMLVRLSLCLIPDFAIDAEKQIALANRVLELLPSNDPFRFFAISAIGYAHLSMQNIPIAYQVMEENRRLSLASGNYYMAIAAMFHLAFFAFCQGKAKTAKDICLQGKACISSVIVNPEKRLPAVGGLDVIRGCVLLEENQLDEAETALLHGLELISGTNNPFYRLTACIALFRLREIQGRAEEAFQFLENIESVWPDIAFCTDGLRLKHLIQTIPEDPDTRSKAESWCRSYSESIDDMHLPGIGPFGGAQVYYIAGLIWVQAQIFLGKPEKTLPYLEKQRSIAEAQGLVYRLIEISLAEVQARKAIGEDRLAAELLEHTLELAETAGCLRIFDQGTVLTGLLKDVARKGVFSDYIERIEKAVSYSSNVASPEKPVYLGKSVKVGLEMMSEREIEVLTLIANGASNQQIAEKLVVTVGTVKSHVNHILSKLEVHNRLEAVACARKLGLIKI